MLDAELPLAGELLPADAHPFSSWRGQIGISLRMKNVVYTCRSRTDRYLAMDAR